MQAGDEGGAGVQGAAEGPPGDGGGRRWGGDVVGTGGLGQEGRTCPQAWKVSEHQAVCGLVGYSTGG